MTRIASLILRWNQLFSFEFPLYSTLPPDVDEEDATNDYNKLTDEQREHFNLLLTAARQNKTDKRAQLYFIDAPGGHG